MLDVGADRLLPCYLLVKSACTLGRAPLSGFAIHINAADLDPNGMNRLAPLRDQVECRTGEDGCGNFKAFPHQSQSNYRLGCLAGQVHDRAVRFCTLDCEAALVLD